MEQPRNTIYLCGFLLVTSSFVVRMVDDVLEGAQNIVGDGRRNGQMSTLWK